MALPAILGVITIVGIAGGTTLSVDGGIKMKNANSMLKRATKKRDDAITKFEAANTNTTTVMDELGKKELDICSKFDDFADVIEKIQGRPEFREYSNEAVNIPKYDAEELKKVSVGASVLLGGLSGAALGTAGGFAAAGVTTSAVMTLGISSTGTAIASLSGAAATNATLAALGGGAVAAGGGGMALGSTMLGVSSAGIGVLVGGIIFNITGTALSKKSDVAYYQSIEIERKVDNLCIYLSDLDKTARGYKDKLDMVYDKYSCEFEKMKTIVIDDGKNQWNDFNESEKLLVQNCVLLVGLLYKMCQVSLVNKAEEENQLNSVNHLGIEDCINTVDVVFEKEFIA